MFKKIGKFFCNIKLRYKLFLVYVVIGVVPVMLTMAASINLMTSIIKEKEPEGSFLFWHNINHHQLRWIIQARHPGALFGEAAADDEGCVAHGIKTAGILGEQALVGG